MNKSLQFVNSLHRGWFFYFPLQNIITLPILTYGCEIWGYENTKQLEKLHLQFCRNILGVRTTTPNFMTKHNLI
jgi:hypothetical protein